MATAKIPSRHDAWVAQQVYDLDAFGYVSRVSQESLQMDENGYSQVCDNIL